MAGNAGQPEVAGQPTPPAVSDGAQSIVALPETEERAEADAIGQATHERQPAVEQSAVPQAAETQQESVWEPADAARQPEQQVEVQQAVDYATEAARLREENRKLQAQQDRIRAQAQAEALRREQLQQEFEARQAQANEERQKYQQYLARIEQERAEARRRAEEAELQRQLAASPPEVRKAFEVAVNYVQQQEARRTQESAQLAVQKMNQYMIQGVPGEVFADLPKDRPVTPEMVDMAYTRYMDWQSMQEQAQRPDFGQWWAWAKQQRAQKKAAPQAAAPQQAPRPVQAPAQPAPVAPAPQPVAAKVTPGTGGRPPGNLEAQYTAAMRSGDIDEAQRIRNLIAVASGVERVSE